MIRSCRGGDIDIWFEGSKEIVTGEVMGSNGFYVGIDTGCGV